eukprot:GFUD01026431.1.p1 GENE.GFUD01026431.1~~GFUD01026431.1.p1  ORF type:complete len:357 (+),score=105.76 GFUD01026431.1:76-1146(+)
MPSPSLPSYIPLCSKSRKTRSTTTETSSVPSKVPKKQISEGLPPWTDSTTTYSRGVVGLHEEIEDFYRWVAPSSTSHKARLVVVERVRACIKEVWPAAQLEIFGSFSTGLYLPTSDLDLVVFGKWEALPLRTLERELLERKIPHPETMLVLDKASVPIIKMVDKITGIKVDISFNLVSGLKSAQLVNMFKKQFPSLPKLVSVLKQFLVSRDLACVYTGGLSSYCLTLMVVSFLQLHSRTDVDCSSANLGVLLLEFLQLYGRSFNYSSLAISVRKGGSYLDKQQLQLEPDITHRWAPAEGLAMEDPFQPGRDIARGSHRVETVKQAWAVAYRQLASGVRAGAGVRDGGVLSRIISWD